MEKFLNLVRSNNMVQAVLCIAFGLFLMIYPSITVQGIILLFGVALILLAIVNVVRAFGLRAFGSSIWIAVLATAVLVGIGGVLIVVNPWGASMTFVLVLGATFIVNGAVDLFIEWYTRDSEKKAGGISRR